MVGDVYWGLVDFTAYWNGEIWRGNYHKNKHNHHTSINTITKKIIKNLHHHTSMTPSGPVFLKHPACLVCLSVPALQQWRGFQAPSEPIKTWRANGGKTPWLSHPSVREGKYLMVEMFKWSEINDRFEPKKLPMTLELFFSSLLAPKTAALTASKNYDHHFFLFILKKWSFWKGLPGCHP